MVAAVEDCFASMTEAQIEALSPKEIILRAMHTAAPYYDAKIIGPVNVQGRLTLEQLVMGAIAKGEKEG